MLASEDWLVFRQQDQIFAERPPVTVWTVAVAGLIRGKVDVIAIELPASLRRCLPGTALYYYMRRFSFRFSAFTAGLIFGTMGQVPQIGRLGESEPFFAFLFSRVDFVVAHRLLEKMAACDMVGWFWVSHVGRAGERSASSGLLCRNHRPLSIGQTRLVIPIQLANRLWEESCLRWYWQPGRFPTTWSPIGTRSWRHGRDWLKTELSQMDYWFTWQSFQLKRWSVYCHGRHCCLG